MDNYRRVTNDLEGMGIPLLFYRENNKKERFLQKERSVRLF